MLIGAVILGLAILTLFLFLPKPKEKAELELSMVVQPDRVNLSSKGCNLRAFSNDEVSFDVYLANRGKATAKGVKGELKVLGEGISPVTATADFGDIANESLSSGTFSFNTENTKPGLYDLKLALNYQGNTKEIPLTLKVLEVDVWGIKHFRASRYVSDTKEDFLSPVDSTVLGYPAMFASTNRDSFVLTIHNGKSEDIENASIKITPKDNIDIKFTVKELEGSIGVTEEADTANLSVLDTTNKLWAGSRRDYIIDAVTNQVNPGKYNFTLDINYTHNGSSYSIQQTVAFGIFNVLLESSVETTENTASSKSFAVESRVEAETANKDIMEINTNFNLANITKPTAYDVIDDSIKEVIEKVFPLYFEKAGFVHRRSDWLKAQLENKTDGEIEIVARALLDEFKFISGGIPGYNLGGKITSKLLEKEGFNALIELRSEGAAKEAGSYYGEVALNDKLNDSTFFDNYGASIKTNDPSIKTEPISISDVKIFLDLSTASNRLPINWHLVYDEDSKFAKGGTGLGDVDMDNLPLTLILDFSKFNKDHGINSSYWADIIIKSPGNTYTYRQGVFGNHAVLNIDRMEKSDYYNTVVFVDLNDIGIEDVAGVSESLVFKVTDDNQPEESHNDVLDFLSQKDIEIMNTSSHFRMELIVPQEQGALSGVTNYIFEKSVLEDEGAKITLASSKYDSSTNITTLSFKITADKTREYTFNVDTSFIEDYPLNKNIKSIQNKSSKVNLTADVASTSSIELNGRYGYDFNHIKTSISGSPDFGVVAFIGLVGTIVGLAQAGGQATSNWITDDFAIYHDGQELKVPKPYTVYVGEKFEPEFMVHYKANGPCDYNELYSILYNVSPGPKKSKWSPNFVGKADFKITASYLARGPLCKKGDSRIKVETSIYKAGDWFYASQKPKGGATYTHECEDGGRDGFMYWDYNRGRGAVSRYRCRLWLKTNGPISAELDITVKNPLKVGAIEVNPSAIKHGQAAEAAAEASVKMQFLQHSSPVPFHVEPSPDITVTKIPITCNECSVTPVALPLTIDAGGKGIAKFKVIHTGEHPPEEKTINLRIKECGIKANGRNENKDWSITAPDTGDRTGSFVCKKETIEPPPAVCGDGIIQKPNDQGLMEECEPTGKKCPAGKTCVDCVCKYIDDIPKCEEGDTECKGAKFRECKNGVWTELKCVVDKCGAKCDKFKCEGNQFKDCVDCLWTEVKCVSGKCEADCEEEGKEKCEGSKLKKCTDCKWGDAKCVKDKCDAYCAVGETKCVGKKTMGCDGATCDWDDDPKCVKDKCDADCGVGEEKCEGNKHKDCGDDCSWNELSCVKDKCGATCASDADCDEGESCSSDTCSCLEPPGVSSVGPAGDSVDVPVDSSVIIIFTKAMDKTTVGNSLSISPGFEYYISWSGNTFTLHPYSLEYSTTYTITVGTGAADSEGNHLESPYSFSFTTEGESAPNQEPTISGITVTQLHEYYEELPHRYQLTVSAADPDGNYPLTYEWSIDCGYFFVNSMNVTTPPAYSTSSNSLEWRYDTMWECVDAQVSINATDSLGAQSETFSQYVF